MLGVHAGQRGKHLRHPGGIVYRGSTRLACAPMSSHRSPLFSLARLRRSTRWAVLALAVFLLRLGIVAVCEPADIAELLSGHADQHVLDSAGDQDFNPAPDEPDQSVPGHCLHCACHFPVALPAAPDAIRYSHAHYLPPSTGIGKRDAPAGRRLRPPIA